MSTSYSETTHRHTTTGWPLVHRVTRRVGLALVSWSRQAARAHRARQVSYAQELRTAVELSEHFARMERRQAELILYSHLRGLR